MRRAAASTLCLACASRVSAFAVAARASPSLAPASLKEGRAPRAPRLPFLRVSRFHGGEQRTGERVGAVELPGPSRYGMSSWVHEGKQYVVIQLSDGLAVMGLPDLDR